MLTRKFLIVMFISIFLFLSILMNCDDDKSPTSADNSIIGTWELTKLTIVTTTETTVIDESLLSAMGAYWTLTIKSNNEFESDYNLEAGPENETGMYSTSGNTLTVNFDSGGSDTFNYTLDGNKLTLTWTEEDDGETENLTADFSRQ